MNCPYCDSTKSKVVDKRDNNEEGTTRRRRECLECQKRFTTYERVENIELTVVKRDGSSERYNREKLTKSIRKAVNKDTFNTEQLESIVDDIESRLLNRKNTFVTSTDIGGMILTRLKRVDPVAYMRFASIYKGFDSLDNFKDELASLR